VRRALRPGREVPDQDVRVRVAGEQRELDEESRAALHTAAEPPDHGRMTFAMSGRTWNSRNAPRKMVAAETVTPR
jgi:hypothetical protein